MYFFSFFAFFRYILSVFFHTLLFFVFFFSHILISISPYCVKNVLIWSYSGPYFPVLGLNTERYRVSLRIQSECRKMRTRATPNTDTFHAVPYCLFFCLCFILLQTILCIYRELSFAAFLCFLYNTDYLFRLFFLVFLHGIFFDMS